MKKVFRFKGIDFTSPGPSTSTVLILASGLIYSFLLSKIFLFKLPGSTVYVFIYIFSVLFLLPSVAYAFLTNLVVKNFYKRRALLLSLINQSVLFFGMISLTRVPSFSLFLFGFIYSINILSIMAVSSDKGLKPLLFPLIYIAPIAYILHQNGLFIFNYLGILGVLCLGAATWLSVRIVDYFLSLNVSDMSAVSLLSSFINEEPRKIEAGKPVSALIQAVRFRGTEDFIVAMPWLHPGPLGNIGGGSMSPSIIKKLNSGGSGYFWHVPTSHEDNPTDPETADDILEGIESGSFDFSSRATKILKREEGGIKVYGQRFGDNYLIFVDVRGVDDFEKSIFQEIRNLTEKSVFFVDIHNHPLLTGEKVLLKDDRRSQKLTEMAYGLLDSLKEEKEHEVRCGLGVSGSLKAMAFVEEIGDDRYLFIALDQNGLSKDSKGPILESAGSEFDETVIITTDTHDKEILLLGGRSSHTDEVKEALSKANRNIESKEVGFFEDVMKDVEVVGKDAHILEASVSFLIHLFILHMLIIYFSFIMILFL